MDRRRKRKVISKVIGVAIQFLGVTLAMLALCTDLDVSADSEKAATFLVVGFITGVIIVGIGLIVEDTRRLKRRLFPAGIVVLAIMYSVCEKAFGRLAQLARNSYILSQDCKQCGASTYKTAQKKYDEFSRQYDEYPSRRR